MLPKTDNPLVVRTDFDNQEAWNTVCGLIRAPVHEGGDTFHAYVTFVEDAQYRNLSVAQLLTLVPHDYKHTFLFVVDGDALLGPDFPILVVDFRESAHRNFRAIPTQVQSIENNLSIANMDFEEFAEAVDESGVFRGFPAA